MQLIRGLHNLHTVQSKLSQGCVLTIGNFDGLHLGHQQVLNGVTQRAAKLSLPSVVMVFEPLPVEYFTADKAPVRLMNFREKIQALQATGVDYVLCISFDAKFATLSAEAFVQTILIDGLNVKHLVVGDDFRFGRARQGNYAYLQASGAANGFTVEDTPTFSLTEALMLTGGASKTLADERVSSTRVRVALQTQNLADAKALLGREFSFNGRVIHGQKLGRTLGFKTLNLNPKRLQMPVLGVFAVTVGGIADRPWPGVANVGLRPTVDGVRPSIEVHLFNWDADLYGRHVEVTLQHFIRPEMKFNGLEALKQQISLDAELAKQFFKI